MKKKCLVIMTPAGEYSPALIGTPEEIRQAERIRGRTLAAASSKELAAGWQLLHDIAPAVWWLRHADDDPEQLLHKAANAIGTKNLIKKQW